MTTNSSEINFKKNVKNMKVINNEGDVFFISKKYYKCINFKSCKVKSQNRDNDFYRCLDCKKWVCYSCSHWGDEDSPVCIFCRLCDGCDKNAVESGCERISRCESDCRGKYCKTCWGEGEGEICGGCVEAKKAEGDFEEKGLIN